MQPLETKSRPPSPVVIVVHAQRKFLQCGIMNVCVDFVGIINIYAAKLCAVLLFPSQC